MEQLSINFMFFTFGALIAILNPVGILPYYIAFTEGIGHKQLKTIIRRAVLVAGGTLIAVSLIGSFILQFFKITIPAFKIAGGIILFKFAMDMIYVKFIRTMISPSEHEEGVAKDDVSVFPLAIPLIAGPGSITTVIMLEDKANTFIERIFLAIALAICIVILYKVLIQAEKISQYLGQIGINIMTRVMGLILAAIATQFIIGGIDEITLVKLF